MKNGIDIIKKHIVILVGGSIIGLLALFIVHLLPTQPMAEHVFWSFDMIEKEFTDEVVIDGYNATLTGNFTDSLMLEYAVYANENHSVLEQVLHMYRAESFYDENYEEGWWPGQSLKDYLSGVPQPREVTYGRYWHGYLVVLKPLLWLTSFNTIRLLNAILQLILVGFVTIEMCKKEAYSLAKAFVVSLPFMFFVSTFASLSLSICLYIMLVSVMVQLRWEMGLKSGNRYATFFLVVGLVTSYFDLLTYPLVTLAYPLCIFLYFKESDAIKKLKSMVIYSMEWFIGYGGMWALKWIVSDLLTDSNIIKDALLTVFVRTQSAENSTRFEGFFGVVAQNAQVFLNRGFLLLFLFVTIYFAIRILCKGVKSVVVGVLEECCFFVLACYPFAWYFVMQNHSEEHWQFTCRLLSITIFAGLTGVVRIIGKRKVVQEKRQGHYGG